MCDIAVAFLKYIVKEHSPSMHTFNVATADCTYFFFFFDVLLTVHLSIFISVIKQSDEKKICYTIYIFVIKSLRTTMTLFFQIITRLINLMT